MNPINNLISELRDKRLWAVAVALLVALVAVPVLLSRGASSTPVAAPPPTGPAASGAHALPVVSVDSTPSHVRLTGRGRDPFSQQKLAAARTTGSTPTTAAGARGSSGSTGSRGSSTSGGAGAGKTTTTTTTTTHTPTTPTVTPHPESMVLTSAESYHVTVSITSAAGVLDMINPLERLSVLPSKRQPLLVELGVLNGGHRVLFLVLPGTTVHGPGICTPGPIDCEILSLAPNQIEGFASRSATGAVSGAVMAVTAITIDQHASAAAADKARRRESAVGRHLVNTSTRSALSLVTFEPSLGAVIERRVTAGAR